MHGGHNLYIFLNWMFTAAPESLLKTACGRTGKGCVPQSDIDSLGAVSGEAGSACYISNIVLDVELTDNPRECLMQLVTIDNRHIIAAPKSVPQENCGPSKKCKVNMPKRFFNQFQANPNFKLPSSLVGTISQMKTYLFTQ